MITSTHRMTTLTEKNARCLDVVSRNGEALGIHSCHLGVCEGGVVYDVSIVILVQNDTGGRFGWRKDKPQRGVVRCIRAVAG